MIVRPFRGLRPREGLAESIASPPYDVLNSEEARQLAEGNPDSFLHVIKPEIDLDPGIDVHDESVYARGAENLRAMIEDGRMVQDESPAYYIYRLVMGTLDIVFTPIPAMPMLSPVQRYELVPFEHDDE